MKQPFFRVNEEVILFPGGNQNDHLRGMQTQITFVCGWKSTADGMFGSYFYRVFGVIGEINETWIKKKQFACGQSFEALIASVCSEAPKQ